MSRRNKKRQNQVITHDDASDIETADESEPELPKVRATSAISSDHDRATPMAVHLSRELSKQEDFEASGSSRKSKSLPRSRSGSTVSQKKGFFDLLTSRFLFGKNPKTQQIDISENSIQIIELTKQLLGCRKEIEELIQENYQLKKELDAVEQVKNLFKDKLDNLPDTVVHYTRVNHTMVGDNNTMSVTPPAHDKLNDLLLALYEGLDASIKELTTVSGKLQSAEFNEGKYVTEIEHLRQIQKEIIESIYDVKEQRRSLDLEYTLQLSNPLEMMEECVNALSQLSKDNDYTFDTLPEKGQLGVLRIRKKYCNQNRKPGSLVPRDILTVAKFCKKLDLEEEDSDGSGSILGQDDCARLLTKWVQESSENNAQSLVDIFPRIKQFGTVLGPQGYESMNIVTSSTLDISSDVKEILTSCNAEIKKLIKESTDTMHDSIQTAHRKSNLELREIISTANENKNVKTVNVATQVSFGDMDRSNTQKVERRFSV